MAGLSGRERASCEGWKGTVSYVGWAGANCVGASRGSFTATYQTDTDWYTITD